MWRKLVPRTKFYGRSNGPVPAGRMLTWSVSGAEKVLFSARPQSFPFLVLGRESYCADYLMPMSFGTRSMQFPITRMILKNQSILMRRLFILSSQP